LAVKKRNLLEDRLASEHSFYHFDRRSLFNKNCIGQKASEQKNVLFFSFAEAYKWQRGGQG
jgi:hypothetical protein